MACLPLPSRYQLIYACGSPTELPSEQARARAGHALLQLLSRHARARGSALGATLAREGVAVRAGPAEKPGAFRWVCQRRASLTFSVHCEEITSTPAPCKELGTLVLCITGNIWIPHIPRVHHLSQQVALLSCRGVRLLPGEALERALPSLRRQLAQAVVEDPPYAMRWMRRHPEKVSLRHLQGSGPCSGPCSSC